jgi:carboxymethylenebutenolidase
LKRKIAMISFKRPDGTLVEAYLIEPANPTNAPGVVVIQEWWCLDD